MFCETTGQWKFSPKSISQKTVDTDPFSDRLKENIKKRMETSSFYPALGAECCNCGVSSYIYYLYLFN